MNDDWIDLIVFLVSTRLVLFTSEINLMFGLPEVLFVLFAYVALDYVVGISMYYHLLCLVYMYIFKRAWKTKCIVLLAYILLMISVIIFQNKIN